jgi:hypothetical protein
MSSNRGRLRKINDGGMFGGTIVSVSISSRHVTSFTTAVLLSSGSPCLTTIFRASFSHLEAGLLSTVPAGGKIKKSGKRK